MFFLNFFYPYLAEWFNLTHSFWNGLKPPTERYSIWRKRMQSNTFWFWSKHRRRKWKILKKVRDFWWFPYNLFRKILVGWIFSDPKLLPLEHFKTKLGGGFKYLLFSPLFGEDSHVDEHIFQRGWNHQLEKTPDPEASAARFAGLWVARNHGRRLSQPIQLVSFI